MKTHLMKQNLVLKILLLGTLISVTLSIFFTCIYEESFIEINLPKESKIFLENKRYFVFSVNNKELSRSNIHLKNDTIFIHTRSEDNFEVGPTMTITINDKRYNSIGTVNPLQTKTYTIKNTDTNSGTIKIAFQKENDDTFHLEAFIILHLVTLAFIISFLCLLLFKLVKRMIRKSDVTTGK